ncbi:exosortase B [Derxia gummosa]|uniref:Exosortase B n=1 Tax=Derxia gummosa DSM 723 TaxID=1121388 RepID=A0A8B6X8C8_9BURK|nr:exosortase B [Derxia gummosa]
MKNPGPVDTGEVSLLVAWKGCLGFLSVLPSDKTRQLLAGALSLAAVVLLYTPVMFQLAVTTWQEEMGSYGPVVLVLAAYLLFTKRAYQSPASGYLSFTAIACGVPMLLIGLGLSVIGHSQQFITFEMGGLPFVFAGIQLMMTGGAAFRRAWFAYVLMIFALPWPGSVIDAATQPMKIAASYGAEHVLYWMGYPVARSGVIITLGPYRLLVADACSGLSSLFALEALGLTYMNVIRHESVFRNVVLALFIVPISYVSNVSRVVFIGLVSFHAGEAAGQGFLHEFSGMVLFVTALMLITSLDSVLRITKAWVLSLGKGKA